MIRIALVVVVPMVAAAAVSGCDDDTTSPNVQDLSAARDLSVPAVHDLSEDHD
jgi:hypothetical protein